MEFITFTSEAAFRWDYTQPVTWFVGLWLFCLGACLGSFSNVVIYRVPAGKSVVRPGSHCPRCKQPIRWYDNVPILSWCVLKARCRDCKSSISLRYPLVELLCGALLLGLAMVEVFGAGANLPVFDLRAPSLQFLAGLYGYHVLLLITLVAVAFINFDGHAVPWKVVAPALLVGLAAPVLWPSLHPLPVWPGLGQSAPLDGWLLGLCNSSAGLAVGLAAGLLTFPLIARKANRPGSGGQWASLVLAAGLVGTFLGWPAAMGIAAITALACFLSTLLATCLKPLRRAPWTGWLLITTLVWVLGWASLFARFTWVQWQGVDVAFYVAVVVLCASALSGVLSKPAEQARPPQPENDG